MPPLSSFLRRIRQALKVAPSPARYTDTVISLTTFGKRVKGVSRTIKSLLRQDVLPAKIMLFVGKQDEAGIPASLRKLTGELFEIRICDDLRSYTKMVPALRGPARKEGYKWLVVCDDDVIYPPNWLAAFDLPNRDDGVAVAHRCHIVSFDPHGDFMRYCRWPKAPKGFASSEELFPTGVGGIALPCQRIHPFFYETSHFLEWAPSSDDVWIYFMLKYSNLKLVHSGFHYKPYEWPLDRRDRLSKVNRRADEGGLTANDRAMLRCRDELQRRFAR